MRLKKPLQSHLGTQTGVQAPREFQLPLLPYSQDALEPFMSARTLSVHYGQHHRIYVDNLNRMTAGTVFADLSLEDLVACAAKMPDKTALFNNAAQVWNHTVFWQSMKPKGGGVPPPHLHARLTQDFGSFDAFKTAFLAAAVGQFGSGCVWLIQDDGRLRVVKTPNADTPLAYGQRTLLACDVWEHAYYLDYLNRRKDFVETYLNHLVNWEFAAANLTWER